MNEPHARRVSLLLPIGSRRAILAATQVVFSLLREGRVEVDILRGHPDPSGRVALNAGTPGAVLFVATRVPEGRTSTDSVVAFEHAVRSTVERAYRRQGIASVAYDLQML